MGSKILMLKRMKPNCIKSGLYWLREPKASRSQQIQNNLRRDENLIIIFVSPREPPTTQSTETPQREKTPEKTEETLAVCDI